MDEQEAGGAAGGGGAGPGDGSPRGSVSGVQDGAAASLVLAGSSLHCAGLSPRPTSGCTDERPRGILKNPSSTLVQRVPGGEK